MNFDSAVSAGSSPIELFATTVPDDAGHGEGPATSPPLVFAFPTPALPTSGYLAVENEPVADELAFFAVFKDASAAVPAESEEPASGEPESDEPAPSNKASSETVAPETLRLIFPVHYFYTDMQVREAASEVPEPASEFPSATSRTPALIAEPVTSLPASPIAHARTTAPAPTPASPSIAADEPTSATEYADASAQDFVTGNVVEETLEAHPESSVAAPATETPPSGITQLAHMKQSAAHEIFAPAPRLPAPDVPPMKHAIEAAAPHPPEIPVQGPQALDPTPTPQLHTASIEPEVPPAAPRTSVAIPSPATTVPQPSTQGESGHDERPREGNIPDREPAPPAPVTQRSHAGISGKDTPRKDERTDRVLTGIHVEQRPVAAEMAEISSRSVASPSRDFAEPLNLKSESPAPTHPAMRTNVEPSTPASSARSVSIAVAGPHGEDVRAVVQTTGDGVQVRLQAGDERTQHALQQGAPELRQRLEEAQRVSTNDSWEGLRRSTESIADVQSAEARFGSQHESGSRDSSPSREDSGGQRQGQRGYGRGERQPDPEATDEEFASYLNQGGKQ